MFEHLKKMETSSDTIRDFTLFDLIGEPVLQVKVAAEQNKPYFNAQLKRTQELHRMSNKGKNINAATVDKLRSIDRELLPKHVIVGWSGVIDTNGDDAPFTPENAAEFCEALPMTTFDELRSFCGDASNFSDAPDAEEEAKNS